MKVRKKFYIYLSSIPNELGLHKKLRYLVLEGNPLKSIRQDILRVRFHFFNLLF